MTIQLAKEQADQGHYSYCFHCSRLRSATWTTPIMLKAKDNTLPIVDTSLVTLPEFCACMEDERQDDAIPLEVQQHFWDGWTGLEKVRASRE
jgi:hypothetical protein